MSSGASTWKTEISNLRDLVGEKYGRGFPVLREIVQNASDAGAGRVAILRCGAGGLGAGRPPFRVPGLLFVNDGRSKAEDRGRLNQIGDSSKAGDAGVVGRHGLGQKSLFHYCDAYFYAGFDEDVAFCDSLNPYSDPSAPPSFARAREWEAPDLPRGLLGSLKGFDGSKADGMTLREAATRLGFGERAFAVWMPYRQSGFRVGEGNTGLSTWTREEGGDPFDAFGKEADIAALIAFTRLDALHFCDGFDGAERAYAAVTEADRFDPFGTFSKRNEPRPFSLSVTRDGTPIARVSGLERLNDRDDALNAAKEAIPRDEVTDEREKADPHGAIVLVRCTTESRPAEVRLASYLPMDGEESAALLPGVPPGLTLYLHGAFFTDRGRQHLHASKAEDEKPVRATWNARLLDRIVLPLIGPALLAATKAGVVSEEDLSALVRALETSGFHAHLEKRTGSLTRPEEVLARTLAPSGGKWRMVSVRDARPVPARAFEMPTMLFGMIPPLRERVREGKAVLIDPSAMLGFGDPPRWSKAEVEALLDDTRGEALSKTSTAELLRDLLVMAGHRALNAIAPLMQRLLKTDAVAQAPDTIRAILNHATPWAALWSNTSGIPATVAAGDGPRPLVLRDEWKPGWAEGHRFTLAHLAALLPRLGPLIERESTDAQRLALDAIRQVGGSLKALFTDHPDLGEVALLRANRAINGEAVILTMAEAWHKSENGTLLREAIGDGKRSARLLAEALEMTGAVTVAVKLGLDGTGLKTVNLDRKAILAHCRTATTFSDETAPRRALLEWLQPRPDEDSRAPRALCAGYEVPDTALLFYLSADHEGGKGAHRAIDRLARKANACPVPVEIAQGLLNGDMQKHLRIAPLPIGTVANWVAGYSVSLTDDEREGLVLFLDEASAELPLHRAQGGDLHPLGDLYHVGPHPVLAALAADVLLLDPADTPGADAPRRAWMERHERLWTKEAEIDAMLAMEDPAAFAPAIVTAAARVVGGDERSAMAERLGGCNWLPMKTGAPARPRDLLSLPASVANAAARALGTESGLRLVEDIAPTLSCGEEWAQAKDAIGLPGEGASYIRLFEMIEQASLRGRSGDTSVTDLVALAEAGFDDGSPVWGLMAALVREGRGDRLATFGPLTEDGEINARLAALGRFARDKARDPALGETARSAYDDAFAVAVRSAPNDAARHARLSGVPVMTATGQWRDAGEVVESGRVARDYRLSDRLAEFLKDTKPQSPPDPEPGGTDADGPAAPLAPPDRAHLFAVLAPLHRMHPDGARLCYALFGTDEDARAAWLDKFGKAEGRHKIEHTCDDVEKALRSKTVDRRTVRAIPFDTEKKTTSSIALDGTFLKAVPVEDGEGVFVNAYPHPTVSSEYRAVLRVPRVTGAGEAKHMVLDLAKDLVRRAHGWMNFWHPSGTEEEPTLRDLFDKAGGREGAVERMIADIRDQLPGTLKKYKRDDIPALGDAIETYRDGKKTDAAKRALWEAATTPEAIADLRKAVRHKIEAYGYSPDRTLLELFQNAHDAYAEAGRTGPVEVTFDGGTLRFWHWGRLVGIPATDASEALARKQRCDLENMLQTEWSDKGEGSVGTFGLGFKCVHLLSDEPRIVSGTESCRVQGGFMPAGWSDGFDLTQEYDRGGHRATLIDMRVPEGRMQGAHDAVSALTCAAEGLLLLSGRIDAIRVAGREWTVQQDQPVAEGIHAITLSTPDGARGFLVFEMGAARLVLRLEGGVPDAAWVPRPTLWRLAPLGRDLGAHWMLDPAARVDAGRTGMHGDDAAQKDVIAAFAILLKARLVALFDASGAEESGLDALRPEGEKAKDFALAFWRGVQDVFAPDYGSGDLRGALHRDGGWGRTARERAVVPNELDDTLIATGKGVLWLDLSLAGHGDAVAALVGITALRPLVTAVNAKAASAMGLGEKPATAFDLCRSVIERMPRLGDDTAAAMGSMLALMESDPLHELATAACFDALEGGARMVADLFVDPPAFAPDTARLAACYGKQAVKFFMTLKGDGPSDGVLAQWAGAAQGTEARHAVFALALDRSGFAEALRGNRPGWMGANREAIYQMAQHLDFDAEDAAFLAKRLSRDSEAAPPAAPPLTPRKILDTIYDWWADEDERKKRIAAYEVMVYPEGCQDLARIVAATREPDWMEDGEGMQANQEAWFTLLALACFRTLPWNREASNRNFLAQRNVKKHWHAISTSDPVHNLEVWTKMLHDWYDETDERIDFHTWRRTYGDLYTLRRYLTEYQRLFATLPGQVVEGVTLTSALTPARLPTEYDVKAPPLNSLIRHGGPWLIRELCRNAGEGRFYSRNDAKKLAPWCWAPRRATRRFLNDRVGLDIPDHVGSVDIHAEIEGAFGDKQKALFMDDHDLPLDILSRDKMLAGSVLLEGMPFSIAALFSEQAPR